jgi:AcrR family transcriptional regulator
MPRQSRAAAARTRQSILTSATALGSRMGLEALSIGTLAGAVGVSRSGITGHFPSKEELQLATVAEGVRSFRAEVWDPVAGERPGIERLRATMAAWLSYLERDVFPGGCFLSAASLEFDGRPGPVRDAVADAMGRWLAVLEHDVAVAQSDGVLDPARDPAQVAFELNGHVMAGNWGKQLFGDPGALESARVAIGRCLAMPGSG